jgi:hypothetical protein
VVKCSEVLQCSGVLLGSLIFIYLLFMVVYMVVYGCIFCILLFNSVGYVFLFLCILIVMYTLFCIFCFHRANRHSPAILTKIFRPFSSVVRQMSGHTSQRRGTVRTVPN